MGVSTGGHGILTHTLKLHMGISREGHDILTNPLKLKNIYVLSTFVFNVLIATIYKWSMDFYMGWW